ncbi:10837_t:CDS:2 [Gigaspora margarita]|uniref:10837_t:CDS:1 n=1 Tax=Gigaspora margarita TaxID=4874 RepID=A0ABN7UCL9_GIGMA|nr:10837_t:CDS:2 [Gigaspora margarita]
MHIKKTHGCGARVVYANLIPGKRINITVESPDNHDNNGVGGLGHFTMHIDNTNETPPKGTWFDVWIPIYWGCFRDGGKKMNCHSEDVHYRTYVQ